jgi:hypothetical protein
MRPFAKYFILLLAAAALNSCKKDYVCSCGSKAQSTTFTGREETISANRRKAIKRCAEIQKEINDPDVFCSLPEY